MAVTDAPQIGGGKGRLKAAAPALAAVGIIASIVGVTLLASLPQGSAPEDSGPVATEPQARPSAPPPPVPQAQFNQPSAAGSTQVGLEIVVKFKDDAKVKEIIDAFWRDQRAAKARFETWKAGRPELARLRLDRVTYSNELVLVHDGSVPAAQRLPAMREIAAKLGAAADISYAEPNMTAQPGGH